MLKIVEEHMKRKIKSTFADAIEEYNNSKDANTSDHMHRFYGEQLTSITDKLVEMAPDIIQSMLSEDSPTFIRLIGEFRSSWDIMNDVMMKHIIDNCDSNTRTVYDCNAYKKITESLDSSIDDIREALKEDPILPPDVVETLKSQGEELSEEYAREWLHFTEDICVACIELIDIFIGNLISQELTYAQYEGGVIDTAKAMIHMITMRLTDPSKVSIGMLASMFNSTVAVATAESE